MNEISINEMDILVRFLDARVTFDDQYKKSMKRAINDSKQRNYKDSTIENRINGTENLRDEIHLIDKHINNFKGLVYERIEMYAYNRFKNSDNVITTTNPDDTSKSDLIHIIDNGEYSFPRCGADVKYGSPSYVVDEYIEKHLARDDSKGFIDTTGYLEPEDYTPKYGFKKLPASENTKVIRAIDKYGYKPTISPTLPLKQYEQIFSYYINYLQTGVLPSKTQTKELLPIINKIDGNQYKKKDFANCVPSQVDMSISDVKELVNELKSQEKTQRINDSESDMLSKTEKHSSAKVNNKTTVKQFFKGAWVTVKTHPVEAALTVVTLAGAGYVGKKHGGKIIGKLLKSQNTRDVAKTGKRILTNKEITKTVAKPTINTAKKVVEHLISNGSMANVSAFKETLFAFIGGSITLEQAIEAMKKIAEATGKNPTKYLQMIINFFPEKAEFATLLLEGLKATA